MEKGQPDNTTKIRITDNLRDEGGQRDTAAASGVLAQRHGNSHRQRYLHRETQLQPQTEVPAQRDTATATDRGTCTERHSDSHRQRYEHRDTAAATDRDTSTKSTIPAVAGKALKKGVQLSLQSHLSQR